MSDSIIIRLCATLVEANICCGLLKANGFDASIDNAHHAAQDWMVVPALGGVAIRLPASQQQPAMDCIVEIATAADSILTEEFGPYDPPVKRRRVAIWTMILIQIGIFQLAAAHLLMYLVPLIPPNWVPSKYGATVDMNLGLSIAPPGPGVNGLVFMIILVLFLCHELISSTPSKPPKEPSV